MIKAEHLRGVDAKAEDAPPFEGKPTFHGYYRRPGRPWVRVLNKDRNPIAYASTDAARAGALFTASQAIEKEND